MIPGVSVTVQALLSSLEREPGEFIVDPWVEERTTLVAACVAQFERWQVSHMLADGALALGIPGQWPHIRTTLEEAGFRNTGRIKVVYLARVDREPHRRQGLGTWLVGQAAQWLERAGVSRVLNYADDTDTQAHTFLTRVGFEVLTRTARGYERAPTTQDSQPGRTNPHS